MKRQSHQVQHKHGPLVPVKSWQVYELSDHTGTGALVLIPPSGEGATGVYSLSRLELLELAREIQRVLDPSPLEKIHRTLEKIEAQLKDIPK